MFLKPHLMTSLTSLTSLSSFQHVQASRASSFGLSSFRISSESSCSMDRERFCSLIAEPSAPFAEVTEQNTNKLNEPNPRNWGQMQEKSKKVQECIFLNLTCAASHLSFWMPNCQIAFLHRNSKELWPRSQTIQNSCSQWWVPGKWNARNWGKESKTSKTTNFFMIVSDANQQCAAQWLHIR